MTVEEVKQETQILQNSINSLIDDFNKKTGCKVVCFEKDTIEVATGMELISFIPKVEVPNL